uniref:non-specific serine/threonine protein kinase n=1 Tax=Rhizophora mucronata TaxID=61149 RepID=A0A2P2KED5_RHIMU
MPRRSPPPPPLSAVGGGGGQLGAFWSTQHANDSLFAEDKNRPKFDEEPGHGILRQERGRPENNASPKNSIPAREENVQSLSSRRNAKGKSHVPGDGASKDFEINFFGKDVEKVTERSRASKTESTPSFQNEAFNTFMAEFDSSKLNSRVINLKSGNEEAMEAEIDALKEQLRQANFEKAEIISKFEKLSAICRSQRQEIQELKQAIAARTPSPNKHQVSPGNRQPASVQEKPDWSSPTLEPKQWHAFVDDPDLQQKPSSRGNIPRSVRSRNANQGKQAGQLTSDFDSWGFESESFSAAPAANTQISRSIGEGNSPEQSGGPKIVESQTATQPAGWAGF